MRATRAYIASLGTTGVLVGCALILLALVSTLVAFNGWPTGGVSDRVESLVLSLGDDEPEFAVSGPAQVALDAAPAALAVADAPAPAAGGATGEALPTGEPAPGVQGRPTSPNSESEPGGGGEAPATEGGGQNILPGIPLPIQTPQLPPLQTPQVPDATGLGETVGRVNPELGQLVTDTGQAVTEIVRSLTAPN